MGGPRRLRELTDLPILLKGILHPDDARQARERGVQGVIVSNHGGRQVDGAVAALDALPGVVDAVGDDLAVMLDAGSAAAPRCVERRWRSAPTRRARPAPTCGACAVDGEDGVRDVLRNLLGELDLTLALSGHTTPATLTTNVLLRK